jgi:hypothetical protein
MPTLDKARVWPGSDIHGPDTRERLYLAAGWDTCYHRDGARYHYRVKLDGNGRWHGFRDAVDELEEQRPGFDRVRFEELAQRIEESDREMFWWSDLPEKLEELAGPGVKVWSCGRCGGYVNAPALENNAAGMVALAGWLERVMAWANDREAGRELAARALEEYDAEKLEELAGPRRVCAVCGVAT